MLFTIMVSPSRKREGYNSGYKVWIIRSVQKGDSPKKDIASKFVIPPNTSNTIKKKRSFANPKIEVLISIKE